MRRLERGGNSGGEGRWASGPNAQWKRVGNVYNPPEIEGRRMDPERALTLALLAKISGVEVGKELPPVVGGRMIEPDPQTGEEAGWWNG